MVWTDRFSARERSCVNRVRSLERNELVAELDRAADQDVRAQAAAVDERAEEACPGDLLQMGARLAQAAPDALDFADPETPPD